MKIENIHIGEQIKKVMTEKGLKVIDVASQLGYTKANFYHLYQRESIDSKVLYKLSVITGFDFFFFYRVNTDDMPTKTIELKLEIDSDKLEAFNLLLKKLEK